MEMSWAITKVGKPEALKRAIDASVEQYSGQSREEFAQAAPCLMGLLDMAPAASAISLNASGYGRTDPNGKFVPDGLNVEIKVLGVMVE
jgi:hypothetical protein